MTQPNFNYQSGDALPDGSVYVGPVEGTGEHLAITVLDGEKLLEWVQADKKARNLNVHGHQDWHLPDVVEGVMITDVIPGGRVGRTEFWIGPLNPDGSATHMDFSATYDLNHLKAVHQGGVYYGSNAHIERPVVYARRFVP